MTGNRLRFGALLFPNAPWPELRRRTEQLEQLGFDAVWVDDHIVNPIAPHQPWMDSWTAAAAIAASTTTIAVGVLASNQVLRHPALLARQALTVDEVSAGRAVVTIASGYAPTDHRAVDQPAWEPNERSRRFAAAAQLVADLLHGRRPDASEWFGDTELVLAPSPTARRPPLYVAAHGPRAIATAAAVGDGWVSFGGHGLTSDQALALTARRVQRLEEATAAAGRDPRAVRRVLLAGSSAVTPDRLWTDTDAFEAFVTRYRAVGIDEFAFYAPPEGVSRAVTPGVFESVAEHVLPRLRDD